MGVDSSRIHFDVTASADQAEREFVEYRVNVVKDLNKIENASDRLRAKLRQLSDAQLKGLGSDASEGSIDRALIGSEWWLSTEKHADSAGAAVKKFSKDAADGLDNVAKSASNGRNQLGQLIEQLAQGDIGGLLGEVAQQGGKAGLAVVGFTLVAFGAVAALAAMTKALLENVREVDAVAREHKLAAAQVQALQLYSERTGQSVDELAKHYKKLGPEIKEIERAVKDSGAAIDNELRFQVQAAEKAWQEMKLAATGALNAIGKELLPIVTVALQDISSLIRSLGPTFKSAAASAAAFFVDVIVMAKEAKYEISLLASGVEKIFGFDPNADTPGKVIDKWKEGAKDIGKAVKGNTEGIRAEVQARIDKLKGDAAKAGSGPSRPDFSGGKSKGKEDISELEKELRILRAAEAEARDLLDSRKESVVAYLEAREKVFEVERKLARLELPNERAAKLKEIDQRELAARRDYFQALEKIASDELEKAQKSVEDNIRVQQQRLEAERKFLQELKALDLERAEIELDRRRATLDREKQRGAGSTQDFARGNPRLALQIKELQLERDVIFQRMAQAENARRVQLQAAEREFADLTEQAAVKARINRNIEAEQARHVDAIKEINRQIQVTRELQDPLSARSLMGDSFANNLELFDGEKLTALAATAVQSFDQMSAAAGNLGTMAGDAFGKFAQGIGQTVESFVLLGTTGPAFLKKLTAQILAQLAAQATVKSLFELAEGFAMLFVNPPAAASHFKAAALYGAVAVTAGIAGRAIAGNSFNQGGGSGSGAGGAAQGVGATTINRGVRYGDNAQEPKVIILRAEYNKGIIISEFTSDYKRNGSTRQMMRGDLSNENISVV